MKLLLQLRSKKQNFWKKILKIASLKMKIVVFPQPFAPRQQHTSQHKITFQRPHPTSC
jgi:hypothetical protein